MNIGVCQQLSYKEEVLLNLEINHFLIKVGLQRKALLIKYRYK